MILYYIFNSFWWIPFAVIIWLLVSVRGRVKRLEREVKELRGGVVAPRPSVVSGQWSAVSCFIDTACSYSARIKGAISG